MSVGYIYILSNPAMPGLFKIGFTNRDVKERVEELSYATGVPKPFEIEYYCLTKDVEEIEDTVHSHFASTRLPGKEFFSVELVDIIKFIDSLIRNVEPDRFCKPNVSVPEIKLNPGAETFQEWQEKRRRAEAERAKEEEMKALRMNVKMRRWGMPRE